jgi:hypothetical protein
MSMRSVRRAQSKPQSHARTKKVLGALLVGFLALCACDVRHRGDLLPECAAYASSAQLCLGARVSERLRASFAKTPTDETSQKALSAQCWREFTAERKWAVTVGVHFPWVIGGSGSIRSTRKPEIRTHLPERTILAAKRAAGGGTTRAWSRIRMIRRRSLVHLSAGTLVALLAAGCGSADSQDPQGPQLRGTYASSSAGPISAISFFDATTYQLLSDCNTATCVEHGSYAVDADTNTLSLFDVTTATTRTLSLRVLDASASASASDLTARGIPVADLHPQNLVEGQETLTSPVAQKALIDNQSVALVNPTDLVPWCGYAESKAHGEVYWHVCPDGKGTSFENLGQTYVD